MAEAAVELRGTQRPGHRIKPHSASLLSTGCCWLLRKLGTGPGASRDVQQRIKQANAEEAVRRAMAAADATALTQKAGQQLLDVLVNGGPPLAAPRVCAVRRNSVCALSQASDIHKTLQI